jgi:CheY-like chemotaxis protein
MRKFSSLSSVLLVDDDDTTNFVNEQLLKQLGVVDRVLVARNGEEALAVLAEACGPTGKTCPALVLLDINMPVMNGIEFLEAYQQPISPIVVIALTTTTNPVDIARLRDLSINAVITKPLTKNKVDAIMNQYF